MNVAAILKEKGNEVHVMKPQATLLEVAQDLSRLGIGSIVICDDGGSVVGIVSERDIVRRLGENGADILHAPVSETMTKDVVTCTMSDTLNQLMADMTAGRFRHLPVIDGGRLVGIVSIGDVVRQRIAEAEMEAAAMRAYIATG